MVIATATHSITKRISVPGAAGMDLSPDGSLLAVGSGNAVLGGREAEFLTLIDTSTLQVVRRVPIPLLDGELLSATVPFSLAWMSNGTILISVQQSGTTAFQLIQWDSAHNVFRKPNSPLFRPERIVRSEDRSKALISDSSTTGANLALYDATLDAFVASSSVGGFYTAANPTGTQFAVMGGNGLTFLDSSLREQATLFVNSHGVPPIFSKDGSALYVSDDGIGSSAFSVFDTSTFMRLGQIPAFTTSTGFSPTGTLAGIDDLNELFVILDRGIAFNGFLPVSSLPAAPLIASVSPASGKGSAPATVVVNGTGFTPGSSIYFGSTPGTALTVASQNTIRVNPPLSSKPGPVDVMLETPGGGAVLAAQAFTYGPAILYVQTNAGSTNGGTPFQIFGYGFDFDPSQIHVTVGGQPALITSVSSDPGLSPFMLPIHRLTATAPSGNAGPADISVSTPTGSTTLRNGYFYYSMSRFAGPTSVGQMVFDRGRQVLYATNLSLNQVDILSPQSGQVTGHLPCGITPQGLALTPDGSTLLVANWGSQSVSVINIVTGSAVQIPIDLNGSGPGSLHPLSVAASNNGKAFIGVVSTSVLDGGIVFQLDLASGALTIPDLGFQTTSDIEIHSFAGGAKVWIGSGNSGGSSGSAAVVWDAATNSYNPFRIGGFVESDITDDGLIIDASGTFYTPEGQVSSFIAPLDLTRYPFFAFGEKLHPGGGLLFKPYQLNSSLGSIATYDVHTGSLLRQIGIPGLISVTLDALAIDNTGSNLFVATDSGIVIVNLNPLPVTIGTVNPSQGGLSGGTLVTVRGSNFQQGATATLTATTVATTWIDQNTLQFVTPPGTAGQAPLSIQNPDGSGYTLPAVFTYVPSVPNIIAVQPPNALAGQAVLLNVFGAGFSPGSVIRWNNIPEPTTFSDPGSLQTIVPSADVGLTTGTAHVSVVNPSGATSNQVAVPVVLAPGQLVLGLDTFDFGPVVVGKVSSPLPLVLGNGGDGPLTGISASATGDYSIQNTCPATLAPHSTCSMTARFSPKAFGVRSGAVTVTSTAANGNVSLTGQGIPTGPALRTFPYVADLGQVIVGGSSQYPATIVSVGSAPATISSVTTSGDYQITQNSCSGSLAVSTNCFIVVTFTPTAAGTRSASILVASDAADSPLVVPLTGIGRQPITLSATSLDFGSGLVLGKTSQQVVVTNPSNNISILSNFSTTVDSFSASSNCGANIYPGQQCAITVDFSPHQIGPVSGILSLVVSQGNFRSPLDLKLTGSGVDYQLQVAPGSSASAVVKAGQAAVYSLLLSDQGYNGTITLGCTGGPPQSTCSVSPPAAVVSGNSSQTISVTVNTRISAAMATPGNAAGFISFVVAVIAILAVPLGRPRALILYVVLLCCGAVSCGGASAGNPSGGGGTPGTGRYQINVSANSGGVSHQLSLSLTVQ